MKSIGKFVLLVVSATLMMSTAEAKRLSRGEIYDPREENQGFRDKHNYPDNRPVDDSSTNSSGDSAIVKAVNDQRRVNFVEGSGMVVTKLLPDDTQGLPHQKWMVRLSNGKQIQAVYNTDMCPHVPLKEGDIVAMGGMFIWTNQGGLIHWLHHDPRGTRPDGYVMVNGKYYCKD